MSSTLSFQKRFLKELQNSKKFLILSTFLGLVVAILYSYSQSPSYTAKATIEVGFEPNTLNYSMLVDTKTKIIQSKFLIKRALAKVDLSHFYYQEIDYKKKELYHQSPFTVYLTKGYDLHFKVLAQGKERYELSVQGKDWEYSSVHRYGQRVSNQYFNLIVTLKNGKQLTKNPYGFVVYSQENILTKVQKSLYVEQLDNSAIISIAYSDTIKQRVKDFLSALVDVSIAHSKESTPRATQISLSLCSIQLGEKVLLNEDQGDIQKQEELLVTLSQNIDNNKSLDILLSIDSKYRDLLSKDIVQLQKLQTIESQDTNSSPSKTTNIEILQQKISTQIVNIQQKLNKEKLLFQKRIEQNIPKKLKGDRRLDSLYSLDKILPSYGLFISLGLLIAIVVAMGLIAIKTMFRYKINSFYQIKDQMKTILIGVVPHTKREFDEEGVVITSLMLTESFRTIRNNLNFMPQESDSQVIAITAPNGGEGRSMIITNLAQNISLNGQRVVVLDLDMQSAQLHQKFNLFNDEGMSSVLSNNMMISTVIRSTDYQNLDVVTAGPYPPNLWSLIQSNRMVDVIQKLRNVYDIILLNIPIMGTDASKLLTSVDVTLFVLRADVTRLSFIQEVDKLNKHTEGFAVILNDVKK